MPVGFITSRARAILDMVDSCFYSNHLIKMAMAMPMALGLPGVPGWWWNIVGALGRGGGNRGGAAAGSGIRMPIDMARRGAYTGAGPSSSSSLYAIIIIISCTGQLPELGWRRGYVYGPVSRRRALPVCIRRARVQGIAWLQTTRRRPPDFPDLGEY